MSSNRPRNDLSNKPKKSTLRKARKKELKKRRKLSVNDLRDARGEERREHLADGANKEVLLSNSKKEKATPLPPNNKDPLNESEVTATHALKPQPSKDWTEKQFIPPSASNPYMQQKTHM